MLIRYNNQDVFSGQAEPFIGKTTSFTSAGDNRILIEETISLVGELTGCGSGELIDARNGALGVFSTGFKNLEVSGIGTFTGVKINALNFDQSPYLNTLPYSVELLHYPSGGYEFGYGITSPQSTYTYTENTNQTVSIQHEVSAQGINTSSVAGGNALTNAQNFVSGQITGPVPRPALIDTSNNDFATYLVDFSETVDKLNNTVSVSRSFESDPTIPSAPSSAAFKGPVILRHTSQLSPTEGEEVMITINGEINAGRETGDAAFQDANSRLRMDAIRGRYVVFKKNLPETFITESITEDTGINLLSFNLSYIEGDNEPDGITDDFTITLEENSDSSLFSVSINGNLTSKGRCLADSFSVLSGYHDEPIAAVGEQSFDHGFDMCESLYRDFYTTEHGSCQDLEEDELFVGLSPHAISKSVAYNEHAASVSYNSSYNDRKVIASVGGENVYLHSFDYTMSFTPSLPGIKSIASAYNNGWIFEDLGYRKRANFSVSTTAKPMSTTTITRGQLYEFGESQFQNMIGPQGDEIITSDEYGVGNQSAINATYAKSFHAGQAFVEGSCDNPKSYTGIVSNGFDIGVSNIIDKKPAKPCAEGLMYFSADNTPFTPPGGVYEGISGSASSCPECWIVGDTVTITWPGAAGEPWSLGVIAEISEISPDHLGGGDCAIGYIWDAAIGAAPAGFDITVSTNEVLPPTIVDPPEVGEEECCPCWVDWIAHERCHASKGLLGGAGGGGAGGFRNNPAFRGKIFRHAACVACPGDGGEFGDWDFGGPVVPRL